MTRLVSADKARALLASLPEGATPGPWGDVGYGHIAQDGDGENPSIVACDWDGETESANAALIAAAPSLRDHLVAALDREERLRSLLTQALPLLQLDHGDVLLPERIAATLTTPGDSDAR